MIEAVWAVLSWQGGLHPWQWAVAGILVAALVVRRRDRLPLWSEVNPGRRVLALGLAAAAIGTAVSLRPQATVNAVAALGLALLASVVWAGEEGLKPGRVVRLLLGGGCVYAAAFLGLRLWFAAKGSGAGVVAAARLLFPNQNLLAGCLALPALLLGLARLLLPPSPALSGRKRPLGEGLGAACLAAALGAAAMFAAGSRGAFLALAAAALWMAWRAPRRGRTWVILAGLAVYALAVAGAPLSRLAARLGRQDAPGRGDPDFYRRFDFWSGAADLSLRRPLLGWGLGSFAAAACGLDLPDDRDGHAGLGLHAVALEHAHNDGLELAVEVGWPLALVLAVCAVLVLVERGRAPPSADTLGLEAVWVAALAQSLVDMNVRTPAVAWGLILALTALFPLGPGPQSGALRPTGDSRPRGRYGWVLVAAWAAALCLVGAALGRRLERRAHRGLASPLAAPAALALQPFDARVAGLAADQGWWLWPWSPWAGRGDAAWWWRAAASANALGRASAAERDALRAVALRPYQAPGWYWLGLKLAADGKAVPAERAMGRALALEPDFCRVLAWKAEQALARGRPAQAAIYVGRIRAALVLKPVRPSQTTRYLQSLDRRGRALLRNRP